MEISSLGASAVSGFSSVKSKPQKKVELAGHNQQRHDDFKAKKKAEVAQAVQSSSSVKDGRSGFRAVG